MHLGSVHCPGDMLGGASVTYSVQRGQMGPATSSGLRFSHNTAYRHTLSWTPLAGLCKQRPHLEALPWGNMVTMLSLV